MASETDIGGTSMNEAGARRLIQALVCFMGPGYHPDTPGAEYVDQDGNRVFTEAGAASYDRTHSEACRVLEAAGIDPCAVACEALGL
jgi:hypothetical protein